MVRRRCSRPGARDARENRCEKNDRGEVSLLLLKFSSRRPSTASFTRPFVLLEAKEEEEEEEERTEKHFDQPLQKKLRLLFI